MTSVHLNGGAGGGGKLRPCKHTQIYTAEEKPASSKLAGDTILSSQSEEKGSKYPGGKTKQKQTPEQTRNLQKCCCLLIRKHSGLTESARKKRETSRLCRPAALQGGHSSASSGLTKFRLLHPQSFWLTRPGVGPSVYAGGGTVSHIQLYVPPRARHCTQHAQLVPSKYLLNDCPCSLSLPETIWLLAYVPLLQASRTTLISRTNHTCPRHASPWPKGLSHEMKSIPLKDTSSILFPDSIRTVSLWAFYHQNGNRKLTCPKDLKKKDPT